jgi:hypothetical protein
VWAAEDGGDASRVQVVSTLLSTVVVEPDGLAPAAAALAWLLDRVRVVTLAPDRTDKLATQLAAALA